MGPDQVAKALRRISDGIKTSENPLRSQVSTDLERLVFAMTMDTSLSIDFNGVSQVKDSDLRMLVDYLKSNHGVDSQIDGRKVVISCANEAQCSKYMRDIRHALNTEPSLEQFRRGRIDILA